MHASVLDVYTVSTPLSKTYFKINIIAYFQAYSKVYGL